MSSNTVDFHYILKSKLSLSLEQVSQLQTYENRKYSTWKLVDMLISNSGCIPWEGKMFRANLYGRAMVREMAPENKPTGKFWVSFRQQGDYRVALVIRETRAMVEAYNGVNTDGN